MYSSMQLLNRINVRIVREAARKSSFYSPLDTVDTVHWTVQRGYKKNTKSFFYLMENPLPLSLPS